MIYKYPNVILDASILTNPSYTKADGTPLDLVVNDYMAQLLDTLAVKHPLWKFELTGITKVSLTNVEATSFHVFNNANPPEDIGRLGISKRYNAHGVNEQVYVISNKRIANSRERGSKVETKHLKVALKTVEKFFQPPPWDERLDEARNAAESMIHYAEAEAARQLRQADSKMHSVVNKFVTDNWDAFLAGLDPVELAAASERVDLYRTHEEMKRLHLCAISRKNMLTVIIEGDKYVVQSSGGTNSYTSEQLTDEVRMKIGMLKLTDEREVFPTIGVKNRFGYLIMLNQQEGA